MRLLGVLHTKQHRMNADFSATPWLLMLKIFSIAHFLLNTPNLNAKNILQVLGSRDWPHGVDKNR